MFKEKVVLSFTYYTKKVDDLILNVVVPSSSGFTQAWENVAAIKNTGIEITLAATPIANKDLKWTTTNTFWHNKAEVTRLDVPAFNTGAFGATLGTYRIEQGKSPTQIVGIGGPDDKVDPTTGLAVYGDGEPDFNFSSYHSLIYKILLTYWFIGKRWRE